MLIPNDYDSAKAYDGGSFATIPVGGHVCRIIDAREATSRNGNPMIEVAVDIAEGGPDDGFYKAIFDSKRASKPDAKWPCVFRTALLTKDGKTSGFFKGLSPPLRRATPGITSRPLAATKRRSKARWWASTSARRNGARLTAVSVHPSSPSTP